MNLPDKFEYTLHANRRAVCTFMLEPLNLRLWTVHRDLYLIDGACWEATGPSDAIVYTQIRVATKAIGHNSDSVRFSWLQQNKSLKQFEFVVSDGPHSESTVTYEFAANIPEQKLQTLHRLLTIEFSQLDALLCGTHQNLTFEEAKHLQHYHHGLQGS